MALEELENLYSEHFLRKKKGFFLRLLAGTWAALATPNRWGIDPNDPIDAELGHFVGGLPSNPAEAGISSQVRQIVRKSIENTLEIHRKSLMESVGPI